MLGIFYLAVEALVLFYCQPSRSLLATAQIVEGDHMVTDVSNAVRLCQRVRHAATSLKIIGLLSAVVLLSYMSDYVGFLAALPFALFVAVLASSTAKWLRAGSRRAAAIAAVWWLIWFGFSAFDALSKSLRAGIDGYSILGALMRGLPLVFLAWGLIAFMRYRALEPAAANVSSALFAPQFDVSDVVRLRQRVGHAATSLKIIGFLSAVMLFFYMSDYVGILVALPFVLFVPGLASSTAKWLRAGSRRAAAIAAVWWLIWFGFSAFDVLPKSLRAGIDGYSILGALMLGLPLVFLAWGLIAFMRYRAPEPAAANHADLRTRPWEQGLRIKTRPRFLSKTRIPAYIFLALSPLPYLWFWMSQRAQESLSLNSVAEAAGFLMSYLLLTFITLHWSVRIYRRARRAAMLPGSAVVKKDTRPIVLYLRSFHDDSYIRLRARTTNGRILPERLVRIPFEEVVTDHLWGYGPVLAIGDPQRKNETAPLGAARDYATDLSWQSKVTELMGQASMIVAIAGQTTGLLWEIGVVASQGFLSKLVLVLPPVGLELEARWRFLESNIPVLNLPHQIDFSRARAVIFPEGCATLVCGNQRSDWTYEAVLDQAALTILTTSAPNEADSRAKQFFRTIRSEVGLFVSPALLVLAIALVFGFAHVLGVSLHEVTQLHRARAAALGEKTDAAPATPP